MNPPTTRDADATATRRLAAAEAIAGAIARDLADALEADGPALRAAARRNAERARHVARLAAGGRLAEQQTTLALVWPRVLERLGARATAHTIRATIPADLPPATGSGETWVDVLTELVSNALAATSGGGLIDVRVSSPRPRRLLVAVEDQGKGIAPDAVPHVFEPFYTSKPNAEGFGLAMVAAFVESLGGSAAIASKPGLGTRVELDVPAARAASAAPDFNGHILVADDDADVRDAIGKLLRSFGVEPVLCDSGTVARSLLLAEPDRFRAAICDIVMPGTPVDEIVRTVREKIPRLPVLLVSGYDTMRMVDGVLALGGVRFLRKPFTREELFAALSDVLSATAE